MVKLFRFRRCYQLVINNDVFLTTFIFCREVVNFRARGKNLSGRYIGATKITRCEKSCRQKVREVTISKQIYENSSGKKYYLAPIWVYHEVFDIFYNNFTWILRYSAYDNPGCLLHEILPLTRTQLLSTYLRIYAIPK